ncbi:hypothetical protein [Butyrivibrio sp. INlla16]|uniref:hypothetical protein n=1 Tax=Butyrivibrio sp. INlla16 TaxID=1520807 RepID=UPI00088EF085|nr:hypothetical protein [Butyrivibrio sp. INlla16]SDB32167.1 hypothetical protein SAMN02910263_01545 [Butyrivibrio sp. INlla16]
MELKKDIAEKDKQKETAKIDISLNTLIGIIALVMALYAIAVGRSNSIKLNEIQNTHEASASRESNLIPFPYSETTKTQNGITITDNGDRTISLSGTCTQDSVVFRVCANDQRIEVPLENKKYIFFQGVDENLITNACKLDIGVMKTDGTTEVLHASLDDNKKIVNGGEIIIDNTDGRYLGIYAISLYVFKGFTIPENYTFYPSIVEMN